MNKNALFMLSLCQKAGKLSSGEFSCEKAIQSGNAKLIILAEDASDNTKKKFINKSEFYKIPIIIFGLKNDIGHSIGKESRVVVAVNDENFALKIDSVINEV